MRLDLGLNLGIQNGLNQLALDFLSVQPSAAYSLRKLRSAYTGNAIRVRRSSDNTEQDIGFINNILDTASLMSFVGSANGFVTTWYDQSGNAKHALQITASSQPEIVSAGSVYLRNGKPSIFFSDGARTLNQTPALASIGSGSVVGQRQAPSGSFVELSISNRRGFTLYYASTTYEIFTSEWLNGVPATTPADTLGVLNVYTGVGTAGLPSYNQVTIGKGTPAFTGVDYISECAFFASNLSTTDRQTLERNQGQYFGITVS